MLKLRYLFDNRDLAIMILENWEYDPASLHMLDYFKISSSAYPSNMKVRGGFKVCTLHRER